MGIRICQADLSTNRTVIVDFIRKNLNPKFDDQCYSWLYLNHPAGPARAWLAYQNESRLIGLAAAFPRILNVSGQVHTGWVLGDFCIDVSFRSLGPAIMLQRACLEEARRSVALCYDFPSNTMMSVYQRLGVTTSKRFFRFVKHLSFDSLVSRILPATSIGRGIRAAADTLLSMQSHPAKERPGLEISSYDGLFGAEFTLIDLQIRNRFGIIGSRSAEEMNWRYRYRPQKQYEVLVVRQEARLSAYLVFACEADRALLVDIFGDPKAESMQELLITAIDTLRRRGIAQLQAYSLESSSLASILGKVGFYRREHAPLVMIFQNQGELGNSAGNSQSWHLTPGDRDS